MAQIDPEKTQKEFSLLQVLEYVELCRSRIQSLQKAYDPEDRPEWVEEELQVAESAKDYFSGKAAALRRQIDYLA